MGQDLLYRLAQAYLALCPPDACRRLAERASDVQCRRDAPARAMVAEYQSLITGSPVDPDGPEVREVFRNFGRYLLEFLTAHDQRKFPVVVEDREQVREVFKPGQGAIILSAHLGSWELGGFALARWGYKVSAVALRHRGRWVNALFDRQRQRCGAQSIPLDAGAARAGMKLLKDGGLLALLGDREYGDNGVEVEFFGRRAIVPRGPALVSLRSGAPAVPIFMIREGQGRFRFHLEPAISPLEAASAPDPARYLTQRYTQAIERAISRYPAQWLMFQSIFPQPNAVTEEPHTRCAPVS